MAQWGCFNRIKNARSLLFVKLYITIVFSTALSCLGILKLCIMLGFKKFTPTVTRAHLSQMALDAPTDNLKIESA